MSPYQSSHCLPVQTDTVSHVNSSHAHSSIAQVLKHYIVIDKTEPESNRYLNNKLGNLWKTWR